MLVARDHASPSWYEGLMFLTVVLVDIDDNLPQFPTDNDTLPYIFYVTENTPAHIRIGKLNHLCYKDLKYVVKFVL